MLAVCNAAAALPTEHFYLLQIDPASAHQVAAAAPAVSARQFCLRVPLALELHLDRSGAAAFVVKVEALIPAAGWVPHALRQQRRRVTAMKVNLGPCTPRHPFTSS